MSISPDEITAVILAGGRGERMGGMDKGMLILHEKPLVQHVIDAIEPHVQEILINANRHVDYYSRLGYPVVEDILGDYFGPLVGMATGMQSAATPLLVSVPCDSPFIPSQLVATLYRALSESGAEISIAHDGTRLQPVYALLRCQLLPDLLAYLNDGGRKIDTWYGQHHMVTADFSAEADVFLNLNTPEDRQQLENKLAACQEIS